MNIVIVGASDRSVLWKYGSLKEEDYPKFLEEYAKVLAKHFDKGIVTPDDGIYTDIALALGKEKGTKPIGY